MAIRVRVVLRSGGRELATAALVNSGYEAYVPEIHLPAPLAEELGFNVRGARVEAVTICGGMEVPMLVLGTVEVRVLVPDRETRWVRAVATSIGEEAEVLLSDKLTDELGVDPERVGEGIWKFSDEPPGVRRTSVEPELWTERGAAR